VILNCIAVATEEADNNNRTGNQMVSSIIPNEEKERKETFLTKKSLWVLRSKNESANKNP